MQSRADNLEAPSKASRVRSMFAEIAPKYDLLNHTLSLHVDKRWRRFLTGKVAGLLRAPGARALDLCCGTGDLSLELGALAPTCGVDFCHPMLELGLKKVRNSRLPVELVEGDALQVPYADDQFEIGTVAFGLRNLETVEGGLREMLRLVKPGGRGAVLEFSRPRLPIFRYLFNVYFLRVLPRIGNTVSGSKFAYQYLPESVQQFPDQDELARIMRSVGFSNVRYYNLFGGVAAVHLGDKPQCSTSGIEGTEERSVT